MSVVPGDVARLIQDVLTELGWAADTFEIAKEVKRLDVGLPCEDEFAVICAWLGKCDLLHKLDQVQVPKKSRDKFQVPDIMAKFSTQKSETPVLIEVKSSRKNVLSFKPDYLERLKNYSSLLGFPLLIAWKWHSMWFLFDSVHLKKAKTNFNISVNDALRENLLGILVGDVVYEIGSGSSVHVVLKKNELIGNDDGEGESVSTWSVVVDDVIYKDYEGNFRNDLDDEVKILLGTWHLEESQMHDDTYITLLFESGSDAAQMAHMALVRLLNWESPDSEKPHWRRLLSEVDIVKNIINFQSALEKALTQKIVSVVLHPIPHTIPDFVLPPNSE